METKNLVGMLVGYYLSRFDEVAYRRFPNMSQAGVHAWLASQIGVPASSLKLWRDEFDPIHPNSRKGWHKRKMAPSRVRMADMLGDVSEVGVFQMLNDCLRNPNADVVSLLGEAESSSEVSESSTRGLTGARAEELFIEWYEMGNSAFHGTLRDCRHLQCGYDFEALYSGSQALIEVKGLKQENGGVLLTDKEWSVANQAGEQYFLVLVRRVGLVSPQIEVFRNPAVIFGPRQNVITVIQVSWTIPALDSSLAMRP